MISKKIIPGEKIYQQCNSIKSLSKRKAISNHWSLGSSLGELISVNRNITDRIFTWQKSEQGFFLYLNLFSLIDVWGFQILIFDKFRLNSQNFVKFSLYLIRSLFKNHNFLKLVSSMLLHFTKGKHFQNYGKGFLFHLKISFHIQDIQFFVLFSLLLYSFQIQRVRWILNNYDTMNWLA